MTRPSKDLSNRRQAILDATWAALAAGGPSHLTIRVIARIAGIDPALIYHYFNSKADLLRAAINIPIELAEALSEPQLSLGDKFALLESPVFRAWTASLLACTADAPEIEGDELRKLVELLLPQEGLRDEAVIIGLLAGRYLYRLEPLASVPVADLDLILCS